MSVRRRPARGGGVVVEIPPADLVGWINRFTNRNAGLAELTAGPDAVLLRATDGTRAELAVPFPPMILREREPIEALLDHVAGLGAMALLLVRGGAHSVGVARDGIVLSSSTRREHLQGRTAAGGWSQQRYARRRGHQLTASLEHAGDVAARVLLPVLDSLSAVVLAGDAAGLAAVLADRRLARLATLPSRTFGDIPEPRRDVLDEVAGRALAIDITVVAGSPSDPGSVRT